MAWRSLKKGRTPYERDYNLKELAPLIEAFSVDKQSAKTLIIEAAKAIYPSHDSFGFNSCYL